MLCQFQVYSKVTQLYIYILFQIFSIIGYYKILSIVPCAIQQAPDVYLCYIQQCAYVNPKLLIYPLPRPAISPLVTINLCSVSESLSVLEISSLVSCFQIPHISDIIQYLSFSVTYFTSYDNLIYFWKYLLLIWIVLCRMISQV